MVPKEVARLKSLDLEEAPRRLIQPLIQRVTPILRDNQDIGKHFQPISVAIGPLHHPRKKNYASRLRRAEKFKLQLAAMFIKHSGRTKEDFYNNVKNHMSSLKKCYDPDEQVKWSKNWDDEDLAWMFLVDGCAVLYFIYLDVNNELEKLGGKIDLVAFAKLDLFLLENQLPFQLLQLLMSLCTRVPRGEPDDEEKVQDSDTDKDPAEVLMECIHRFINMNDMNLEKEQQQPEERLPQQQQQQQRPQQSLQQRQQQSQQRSQQQQPQQTSIIISDTDKPAHLLALLHKKLIGVKLRNKGDQQEVKKSDGFWGTWKKYCIRNKRRQYTYRGATELKEKGIFFEALNTETISFTDSEFSYDSWMPLPTLKLHRILVDDSMIPKLLNLIAYEMCPDFKNDYEITTYVAFLDSLIDKGDDVKELRVTGVLHNGLGSDEAVAELFNKISDYLVPNPELQHLSQLQRRIQEHCNSVWVSDLARLYYKYFRTPWSFAVFVGVIAGLLLTGLQTYRDFNKPAPQ